MNRLTSLLLVLLITAVSLSVRADDQGKAEKQANKVSAMAADLTGRRVVNQSIAEQFKVKKSDLVAERLANNLNYGSLFIVHQLILNGTAMADITARLKSGKSVYEIGNEFHADWKQIADQGKKLNSRIEDNLYNFFIGKRAAPDSADVYDGRIDGVSADSAVSQQDIADAQTRYIFWRDRASVKQDGTLEHNKEQAARQTVDPVRKGGPQADQVGNTGPTVTPR